MNKGLLRETMNKSRSEFMSHIDGYADYLVETIRKQLGYDSSDNSHDDKVLSKLQSGEKLSKSKHLNAQQKGELNK
jgi:hypothetical protein